MQRWWKNPTIAAAIIGAVAVIIAAIIQRTPSQKIPQASTKLEQPNGYTEDKRLTTQLVPHPNETQKTPLDSPLAVSTDSDTQCDVPDEPVECILHRED